jgi:two-component system sensor histidine kinase PilS (NtrC family)
MNVDLEAALKRLMVFRVVIVTTLLSIATYVEAVSETLFRVNPLYFVIGATYALTVVHAVALRSASSRRTLAYAQVVGDLVIITALVQMTGGVWTGFLLLYPLSVLSATMLVPRRGAVTLAGLATALYGVALLTARERLVPSQGLADVLGLPPRFLLYSIFVLGVACATVALLGSYLGESLQHAGRKLEEAAVEVADLRELNDVIVNSIQSGLMTTDAEGRILYVNRFGEAILGRSPAALRGSAVRAVLQSPLLGPPELGARAASRALATPTGGRSSWASR